MTFGAEQSWDAYQKFFNNRFLPAVKNKVVLFMAGDVHENRLPPPVRGWPIEIVSSAAVLSGPYNKRNFAVVELLDAQANVFLYKRGEVQFTDKINLKTGSMKTTMSALMRNVPRRQTVKGAQTQRRNALRRLEGKR